MNDIASDVWKRNLVGSIWMIAAMGVFSIEDSLIKYAARTLPIGEVLFLFGLGGSLIFAFLLRMNGRPFFIPDVLSRPMLVRVVFEITGRLFYVLAIVLIPLSTATVILQATPLVVVAGAVLMFGEKAGWRRWLAVAIGLAGVVVVVQPGAQGFSTLSFLPIVGMIGFAGRDLASRAAPATVGTLLLGLYGFVSVVVAAALFSCWDAKPFVVPGKLAMSALFCAAVAGAMAYSCLMIAMRTGEISAVTPFRYTRLLFGCVLGVVLFGEVMTAAMLVGSVLIVLSGIFVIWRGKDKGTGPTREEK